MYGFSIVGVFAGVGFDFVDSHVEQLYDPLLLNAHGGILT